MLRDITTTVSDGLLGFATAKGTGIFAAIGASPIEESEPVTITGNMGAAKIKERLGLSPLADAVMDAVENGANRVYCIPVEASVDGTVGTIEKEAQGGGELTVEGKPYNAYQVVVEITGKGGLNSAAFTYSIDGSFTRSDEITVPLSGEYEIEDTGLKLKFTEGSGSESFQVGDVFRFSTEAPQMTNADALAAIGKLKYFNELYEFVYIVGESTPAMWTAVSAEQKELEEVYKKPLWFLLEAYRKGPDEEPEDYALRLETDRKQVKNYAVAVCAQRGLYVKMDGTTREINLAGVICGLVARSAVQKSISRTRDSEGMGVGTSKLLELRPGGMNEYTELLDTAGYITFREYAGLEDFFVTAPRVMGPDGTDFRYIEDVRVLHKIIREVRKAGLPLLHDDIDMTGVQGELEKRAKLMEEPLEEMIDAEEISDAEITVPENQDVIKDERMDVVIRYVSRGYIREIRIDLGRSNVTA